MYGRGAERGLFLSPYQRSIHNVDTLTSRPWWTYEQTKHKSELEVAARALIRASAAHLVAQFIERHWRTIRDEAMLLLDKQKGVFKHEDESLTQRGEWQQFALFMRGT